MKDEFANRMGMFRTALGILNEPTKKPVWHNQPPAIFMAKVTAAEQAVDALGSFLVQHSADITGSAVDKAREEKELEDAAFSLGSTLAIWFRDHDDETSAAQVERPISGWRRMRDQELIVQAKLLRDLAQGVVSGPSAMEAAQYDLTAASVAALSAEIDDYEATLSAPQQAIAARKALTAQFRTRFNEVEANFDQLDKLILRFDKTAAGRDLIAAYQASRTIRDYGSGPRAGGADAGGDLPTRP